MDEESILDGTEMSNATSSDDKIRRLLLVRTFSGQYVGIKLYANKPKTFENEKARFQWDLSTAKKAMRLRAQLESGRVLPEQVKDWLDFDVPIPEEEEEEHKIYLPKEEVHRRYRMRYEKILHLTSLRFYSYISFIIYAIYASFHMLCYFQMFLYRGRPFAIRCSNKV